MSAASINRMGKRPGKRALIYRRMLKEHNGRVPCFVCGEHVRKVDATLEHIVPRSKGGTLAYANLSISHHACNQARGNCESLKA